MQKVQKYKKCKNAKYKIHKKQTKYKKNTWAPAISIKQSNDTKDQKLQSDQKIKRVKMQKRVKKHKNTIQAPAFNTKKSKKSNRSKK